MRLTIHFLVEWVLFDTHTESVYEAEVDKMYER